MRARSPWAIALMLALFALAVWRAACVLAGPDIDTDAYAHHMIARAILADPLDLAVHWVWLPLFHYAQVPLVALGGTMDTVRWVNVALSAALPIVLYAYVARTSSRHATARESSFPPAATAFLAALLAAMCPISMQMGTTAQPEPLFALLVLLVAIAFERRLYRWASVFLGAAVMLRYEGWAVLAACVAVSGVELLQRLRERPDARAWESWKTAVLPIALIVVWAALRRPVDGQWFGFLRQTHEFANDALHEKSPLARGLLPLVNDALYYPLFVPVHVMGLALVLLVPFGVLRTLREQGARFVLVFVAVLGFISLTWMMRATLGLDRHFVGVVPLYATFAAQGIAAIADAVGERARRWVREPLAKKLGVWLGGAIGVLAVAILSVELTVWMGYWRASIDRGWPDRAALGAYLRTLPEGEIVFCDDATLEILSRLDRQRFDRHWLDDPRTWELVANAARRRGVAYVATWRRKLLAHEGGVAGATDSRSLETTTAPDGESPVTSAVVFQAGADARDDTAGVEVMRVTPDNRPASR